MSQQRPVTVRVRRAPRFGVFLIIGGLVGILAALIVVTAGAGAPSYSVFTSFSYYAAIFIIGGILLGALAALFTDWFLRRRTTDVDVTGSYEPVETRSETPDAAPPIGETPQTRDEPGDDGNGVRREGDGNHTNMGH